MTSRRTLPYRHPTSIVLIDDDTAFLKNFPLTVRREGPVETFSSPAMAVRKINDQAAQLIVTEFSGNIDKLGSAERFDRFSVLITDYEMDAMNGIEVCKGIGDSPVGRILLTGKVDERYAVQAFNEDVIDRYIRKDDPLMVDLIKRYIVELKDEFFQRSLSSVDESGFRGQTDFLYDTEFADYFETSCRENEVVEHYLDTAIPGFVLLDAEGEVLVFKVLSEMQMAQHTEMASSRGAPLEFLELLRSGQAMPFFPSKDGFFTPEFADSWKRWTFATRPVEGAKRYYTAVVSGPEARTSIADVSIYPYNTYLQEKFS